MCGRSTAQGSPSRAFAAVAANTPERAMYTTCMFCKKPLETNEVVETFPVGRRLAFDSAKGRLWVVCRRCERWNLTPLEERWEAVETCEEALPGDADPHIVREHRPGSPPRRAGTGADRQAAATRVCGVAVRRPVREAASAGHHAGYRRGRGVGWGHGDPGRARWPGGGQRGFEHPPTTSTSGALSAPRGISGRRTGGSGG